jgi:hypothetical protein
MRLEQLYHIGDVVYFYHKYTKEIFSGKITSIRLSNLNWDYEIRYNIYYMDINIWVEQKYINKNSKQLENKFL